MTNTSTPDHQIIHGNCLQVLPTLAAASVNLIVTDPPYLVSYRDRDGRGVVNDDAPDQVLGAFPDLYRVLAPDSTCVSFYGWGKIDLFFRAWVDAGFRPIGHLVWHKGYASYRGFVNARHEQAYILAKGRPRQPAEPIDDVQPWEYSGNRCHPTEKAVSILTPLIESFSRPGDVVLDPFMGSGSTLVGAALAGRKTIGIELEEKYCTLARKRLAGATRYASRLQRSSVATAIAAPSAPSTVIWERRPHQSDWAGRILKRGSTHS